MSAVPDKPWPSALRGLISPCDHPRGCRGPYFTSPVSTRQMPISSGNPIHSSEDVPS